MVYVVHQLYSSFSLVNNLVFKSANLGLVISWQISSDYGSGAFPPTINPMNLKWEPRTPLSEGPRSSIGG